LENLFDRRMAIGEGFLEGTLLEHNLGVVEEVYAVNEGTGI
jgi:hypothetical protein